MSGWNAVWFSSLLSVNMASKVELFRTVRNVHQEFSLDSSQSNQNSRFNPKNLFILLVQSLALTSVAAFLVLRANSIGEIGISFSSCAMILSNIIFNVINIVEIKNIAKLIGQFEDFIEMSKFTNEIFDAGSKFNKISNACNRITIKFDFKGRVYWNKCQNRAPLKIWLQFHSTRIHCWLHGWHFGSNLCQLLHFR